MPNTVMNKYIYSKYSETLFCYNTGDYLYQCSSAGGVQSVLHTAITVISAFSNSGAS